MLRNGISHVSQIFQAFSDLNLCTECHSCFQTHPAPTALSPYSLPVSPLQWGALSAALLAALCCSRHGALSAALFPTRLPVGSLRAGSTGSWFAHLLMAQPQTILIVMSGMVSLLPTQVMLESYLPVPETMTLFGNSLNRGSLVAQLVKNPPVMQETWV